MKDPAAAADAVRIERYALDELAPRALFELMRLRVDVFVVEQACPYPELDDVDLHPGTRHVLARLGDRLVGCARTMAPGSPVEPARIGRVVVRDELRGTGLARVLMERTLDALAREHPGHRVALGAQLGAERFYASLGFGRVSDEYVEDGIPHVGMDRPGSTVGARPPSD